MQCPFCGKDKDKVVDSRSSEGGRVVRRRRQCLACGRRFTTYERPEDAIRLTVIKKDESREPYQRQKVIEGLRKACYKRPVTEAQIAMVADATEERMLHKFDRDVPANFIGDEVSRHLLALDKIAYVRFASVYRQFADVGELIDEASHVRESRPVDPDQKELFDQ